MSVTLKLAWAISVIAAFALGVICGVEIGRSSIALSARDDQEPKAADIARLAGPVSSAVSSFPARPAPAARDALEGLLDAIRTEESIDGRILVGDKGKSKGSYHIGRDYWQDGCEFGGVDWEYDTLVYSELHCRHVIRWYWQRWCEIAYEECELEVLARVHNGGPNGYMKASTVRYWQRVQDAIRE